MTVWNWPLERSLPQPATQHLKNHQIRMTTSPSDVSVALLPDSSVVLELVVEHVSAGRHAGGVDAVVADQVDFLVQVKNCNVVEVPARLVARILVETNHLEFLVASFLRTVESGRVVLVDANLQ